MGAGINGQDIARPAEFVVDVSGTVRWVNLTENYWVRARPAQVIELDHTLGPPQVTAVGVGKFCDGPTRHIEAVAHV